MKAIQSKQVKDTEAFATSVASDVLERGLGESAAIIALSGELGAGKTTFTKGFAKALGVVDVVTSPTFILEKIYLLEKGPFKRLVHIDAYRLESAQELSALGWDEIIEDPENMVVIEWPEKVEGGIPAHAITIHFTHRGESERDIQYA